VLVDITQETALSGVLTPQEPSWVQSGPLLLTSARPIHFY